MQIINFNVLISFIFFPICFEFDFDWNLIILTSTLILTFFNSTNLFRVGQCQNIADCSVNGGKVGGICSEAQVIHENRRHLVFLQGFQTRPFTYGVSCQYYFNLYQNNTKGDIAVFLSLTVLNLNNSMLLRKFLFKRNQNW